eukprot:1891017-Pleurochrysis_carterae.AAC.1
MHWPNQVCHTTKSRGRHRVPETFHYVSQHHCAWSCFCMGPTYVFLWTAQRLLCGSSDITIACSSHGTFGTCYRDVCVSSRHATKQKDSWPEFSVLGCTAFLSAGLPVDCQLMPRFPCWVYARGSTTARVAFATPLRAHRCLNEHELRGNELRIPPPYTPSVVSTLGVACDGRVRLSANGIATIINYRCEFGCFRGLSLNLYTGAENEYHKTAVNQSIVCGATPGWRDRGRGTLATKYRWD